MFDENYVLTGPDIPEPLPEESLGPYCFRLLKEQPQDKIILTEAESGKTCTVEEYLRLSVNAAATLRSLGIEPGDIVCLVGGNTIAINVIAMGTLLVGAVWTPIDPSLKSFEYQHLIKLFQPKALVGDPEIVPVLKDAIAVCQIDVLFFSLQEVEDTKAWESVLIDCDFDDFQPTKTEDLQELAVMVCSSGSTGLPKGVQLSHNNILFAVFLGSKIIQPMPADNVFLHTSHFFWISGVFAFFVSNCLGVRRILVNDVTPEGAMQAIHDYTPFWGLLAPSLLNSIVHHPDCKNYNLAALKVIITAGSPLNKGTHQMTMEVFGENVKIGQAYGLSEVSGSYSSVRTNWDPMCVGTVSYGTAIKIVDTDTGENLAPGEEGELHISSLGMMLGYVNNPKATAETIDEEGWLHTGDVGYVTKDGAIFITGRIKELMKLDNHQIAPAEIEQVINTVPGVGDVAVAGIKISDDNSYPMALVVKEEDSDVSEEEIIKCVNENLSEFKQLRAGVCFVDEIPRTMTGKIKRAALQALADELYMGDTPTIF